MLPLLGPDSLHQPSNTNKNTLESPLFETQECVFRHVQTCHSLEVPQPLTSDPTTPPGGYLGNTVHNHKQCLQQSLFEPVSERVDKILWPGLCECLQLSWGEEEKVQSSGGWGGVEETETTYFLQYI